MKALPALRPIRLGLPQGAAVFLGISLMVGVSYFVVRRIERQNPRRDSLKQLWASVVVGAHLTAVIETLGVADDQRQVHDMIAACPEVSEPCTPGEPSPPPCKEFHTCVREYSWYVVPSERSGEVYTACVDSSGIVRRTSHGMAFNLRSW